MSLTITPSKPSPAPLGAIVTFTATVTAPDAGTLSYRFRTRYTGIETRHHSLTLDFRTVVDFGPNSTLDWTTIEREGTYEIEASVKNSATGEMAQATMPYVLTKLATGSTPVGDSDRESAGIYLQRALMPSGWPGSCPVSGRKRRDTKHPFQSV